MRQLIFLLLAATLAPVSALQIPDRDLRSAISIALGIPAVELTEADLAGLIDFDPGDLLITDLSGLEHAINLESAVLDDNQLTDLSPLSSLTKLRTLDLHDNRITDLSPLAGLAALEVLILEDNDITDFTPLTNLPSLTSLILDQNKITTIPDLSGLIAITNLSIVQNNITDATSLLTIPATASRIDLTANPIDHTAPGTLAVQSELDRRGIDLILTAQNRVPTPPVSIAFAPAAPANITISWPSDIGVSYQLRFSEDLSTWHAVTSGIGGTGSLVEILVPLPTAQQGFFEVLATKQP